ncbi:MAG: D-aminoacyl-tRNA deacylase [Candidatus Tectomicrobia bacterium]|nr:D-aminoacyl-tRNA deacylase [Candidatus Tectomicrobia bacterium]
MRAVVQRVSRARVDVDGDTVGAIERGLLVLLGVQAPDTERDADYLAAKIVGLRIFNDAQGKMNLDVRDVHGAVLVVSQFTLYGDARKGRRPSFVQAAAPEQAEHLYEYFLEAAARHAVPIAHGVFGAHMQVHLVNDGPVTLLLDSPGG